MDNPLSQISGTYGAGITLQSYTKHLADNAKHKLNVKDFGAKGNGITDDTAAIQAGINSLGSTGGILFIPKGNYKITNTIVINGSTTIQGDGREATRIVNYSDNNAVQIWGIYNAIKDLTITANGKSGGSGIFCETVSGGSNSAGTNIDCIIIENHLYNIRLTKHTSGFICRNLVSQNPKDNGACVLIEEEVVETFFTDCIMSGNAVPGSTGLRIKGGTGNFFTNVDIVRCNNAIEITPINQEVLWQWFTNVLADSSLSDGIRIQADEGSAIYSVTFNNCWAGSNAGTGILLNAVGTGVLDGIEFIGTRVLDNGYFGFQLAKGKNVSILGGTISGNTNNGVHINAGVSEFKIECVRIGKAMGRSVEQPIGIRIDPGSSDNFIITGCDCRVNTFAGINDNSTGINKVVANNLV
jgi:hypothetical protein